MSAHERYRLQRQRALERELVRLTREWNVLLTEKATAQWAEIKTELLHVSTEVATIKTAIDGLEQDMTRMLAYLELLKEGPEE